MRNAGVPDTDPEMLKLRNFLGAIRQAQALTQRKQQEKLHAEAMQQEKQNNAAPPATNGTTNGVASGGPPTQRGQAAMGAPNGASTTAASTPGQTPTALPSVEKPAASKPMSNFWS